MKTISISFVTILATLCISGCSSKDAAAPDCSDPGVIKTANGIVFSIYDKKLVEASFTIQASNILDLSIVEILPVAYNEAIRLRSCVGKLTVTAKQPAIDKMNAYMTAMQKFSLQIGGDAHRNSVMDFPPENWELADSIVASYGKPPFASSPIEFKITYTVQMQEKSQGGGYNVTLQMPTVNYNSTLDEIRSHGSLTSVDALVNNIVWADKRYPEVAKAIADTPFRN